MSASTPSIAPEWLDQAVRRDGAIGLHVAVGVIRNPQNQVLIAQRQPGVHLAGCWEFPGGKVESGETTRDALRRELQEELDITLDRASPLIKVRHRYPERRVLLDVWQVASFRGTPRGLQGQSLRWVDAEELPHVDFPGANRPIANAARLPDRYAILDSDSSDPQILADMLERLADNGLRLIQLRAKGLLAAGGYRAFAARAVEYCRARGIVLLLNAAPRLVEEIDADGVHLNAARLVRLRERPLSAFRWVAASCHSEEELQHAERLVVDFAVLAPVARTRTHPDAVPLGWSAFGDLVERVNLPVFALGGLTPDDLGEAIESGAQGIAAVRGFL